MSVARGIVEILSNEPFRVLVTSLKMKAVTIPKHSRLARLSERPIVVVNMLDDIDTDPLDTQVESVNAHPVYIRKLTTVDLTPQHEAGIQRDFKTIKTD